MVRKRGNLPIDRGWAWVIVAAASCLLGMQIGSFKCQGILLVELVEHYEGSYPTSTLIWVGSLKYFLSFITAPLLGFLIVKSSHRTISIIGILLACGSYIGLAYAPNFPAILLLYSLPCGLGEGMIYLSGILVSNQYFQKQKALALGIIASGSGAGVVILPHIYRLLFDNYSFSGACLLLGGVWLQFMIPACLYRPISYYGRQSQGTQSACEEETKDRESDGIPSTRGQLDYSEEQSPRAISLSMSCQKSADHSPAAPFNSHPQINLLKADSRLFASIKDIAGSGIFLASTGQIPATTTSSKVAGNAKDKFVWRVILLPKFSIVALSTFFYAFGTAAFYNAVAGLGEETGVPKSTVATAMMISGFVEIPSRILNGLFADRKLIPNTTQYALALLVPGLMCLVCAQVSGLAGIALVLTGMSTLGTSVFSLIPMVIIELVGPNYVTSGMSIQLFGQSLALLPSSYITGAIYDANGSWKGVFYYLTAVILLAATVVWPYCLVKWCRERCVSQPKRVGPGRSIVDDM